MDCVCWKTLDDDDDGVGAARSAAGSAVAAASADEVDPLDAFMSSLSAPKKPAAAADAAVAAAAAKPAAATEEIDPLDAFMATLSAPPANRSSSSRSTSAAAAASTAQAAAAGRSLDLDDDDAHASYLASSERRTAQRLSKLEARAHEQGVSLDSLLASSSAGAGSDDDYDDGADRGSDDDEGGKPRAAKSGAAGGGDTQKREVKSLRPLDHSTISYAPFRKNFYTEHAELAALPEQEMRELTEDFDVQMSGSVRPRLCYRWSHFGFPPKLLAAILRQGFEAPTPIQAQAIPCALMGKDIIGVAKTGSGKTSGRQTLRARSNGAAKRQVSHRSGSVKLNFSLLACFCCWVCVQLSFGRSWFTCSTRLRWFAVKVPSV